MIHASISNDFESWRNAARQFLAGGFPPEQIIWTNEQQGSLLPAAPIGSQVNGFAVPAEFLELAKAVSCHDGDEKWPLLYRILYRLRTENRNLLQIESDADVSTAKRMARNRLAARTLMPMPRNRPLTPNPVAVLKW